MHNATIFLFLSIFYSGLFWVAAPLWAQGTPPKPILTIAADEWCPINCNPDDKQLGVGIDLARQVFEPLGYQIKYVVMPWTEALEQVHAGKVDAVVGANYEEGPELVFPSEPIYKVGDDFYVLKGSSWRYQGPYTLSGRRVGVIEGYGYDDITQKFIETNKNIPGAVQFEHGSNALQANIGKLIAGKIDVVVESRPVMDYTLHIMGMEDKIIWAGGISQEAVYLAFSPALPQSKLRAQQYDAAIKALKAAGKLGVFYKAYGLKP